MRNAKCEVRNAECAYERSDFICEADFNRRKTDFVAKLSSAYPCNPDAHIVALGA